MSRFYGSLSGSAQAEVTRRGTEASGISSHTRGWDLGIKVAGNVDYDGKDSFRVMITGGSHNASKVREVFVVYFDDEDNIRVEFSKGIPVLFDGDLNPLVSTFVG